MQSGVSSDVTNSHNNIAPVSPDLTGGSVSIIIPTFNRWPIITKSVDSALQFISKLNFGEVIVVDDASNDDTVLSLRRHYARELEQGAIQILTQQHNQGPDVARNLGARHAKGFWLLFLDSDDWLIPELYPQVEQILSDSARNPIVFFRCIDINGKLVGPMQDGPRQYEAREFLISGTPGECIPTIKREVFLNTSYDEDLRGWGGPTYYRIIKKYGPAKVHPLGLRIYNTEGSERMSSKSSLRSRAYNMARGHGRILKYCIKELYLLGVVKQIIRICYYLILAIPIRSK